MNSLQLDDFIDYYWSSHVIHELSKYIRIKAITPSYDADWKEHGALEQAADLMAQWARMQHIRGLKAEVIHLERRTPLLFVEIPGDIDNTVLFYGHLDKMPPSKGWSPGLGPWKPVYQDGKLYGRGSVDDGYAFFSAITAIKALQEHNIPHGRCVIVIEACEEGGSVDLSAYLEHLKRRIGEPEMVLCLDTGCGDYEHLWLTTSVRGYFAGNLTVEVLKGAVHSGGGSGIIPSAFQILIILLERIFDAKSGKVFLKEAKVKIPRERVSQAKAIAKMDPAAVYEDFPLVEGCRPLSDDSVELLLNRTWRPTLTVTGADGLPELDQASNVILPVNTLRLSFRIPPGVEPHEAMAELKQMVEKDPPFGAHVKFEASEFSMGWNAPKMDKWLQQAVNQAAENYYEAEPLYIGEGGFISVLNYLQESFPETQIVATGCSGPGSSAHGPNEFLHVPMAKKVTCCVAHLVAEHYQHANNKD